MGEPIRGLEGLGAYLRKIRVSRKLSLDSVAELTGGFRDPVTKSHLSRIENGRAEPSFRRLYALCQVYKVSITSLAERYELDLRKEDIDLPVSNKVTPDEMMEEANELCRSGDYVTAMAIYEMLLDQDTVVFDGLSSGQCAVHLRICKINCLVQLKYYSAARNEVEELLDREGITPLQRCLALNFLAITIWRQGRLEYATVVLKEALSGAESLKGESVVPAIRMTQGTIAFRRGLFKEALEYFQSSSRLYVELAMTFQRNIADRQIGLTFVEMGKYRKGKEILSEVLQVAQQQKYEKQMAMVLGDLAMVSWNQGDMERTESLCRRSNSIARPRDYIDLVFRNCYYLWKVAETNGNQSSLKFNYRTLRSYQGRVDDTLPELQEFERVLGGGVE